MSQAIACQFVDPQPMARMDRGTTQAAWLAIRKIQDCIVEVFLVLYYYAAPSAKSEYNLMLIHMISYMTLNTMLPDVFDD